MLRLNVPFLLFNMMGKKRVDWERIRWGTLTKWLKRNRAAIRRRYGEDPFTKRGTMNARVLRRLARDDAFLRRRAGSAAPRVKRKILFRLHVLGRR